MVRQRKTTQAPRRQSIEPVRPMFFGGPDPITLNRMEAMVNNFRTMQGEWLRRRGEGPEGDRRRNYSDEFGYPDHEWNAEEYRDLINCEPLACLANELFPIESWGIPPSVYETEDEGTDTDFEIAYRELPKHFGGEPSYFAMEQDTSLLATYLCADILAGEGRHGVIILGVKDGKDLSEPCTRKKGQRLKWVRALPEYLARVSSFDTDPRSDRIGLPETYEVTLSDPKNNTGQGINENHTTTAVHWSRVVHIVDKWHTAPTSANFAVPRLKVPRDCILDYRKARGSSAEGYYKACFVGVHFGTHPQLGADVNVNIDSLKDMWEEYQNGMQRALFTNGMAVDQLTPAVIDPNPFLLAQLQAVCLLLRVPMRILMGSERGELASGDDKIKWNNRLASRQGGHNTPNIIVPFVNRLINLGILPEPKEGYRVWWPPMSSLTPEQQATVLLTKTQAYAQYVMNDLQSVVPPLDYMTKFDDLTKPEAEAIIEAAEDLQLDLEEEAQERADELGLVPDMSEEGFKEPPLDPDEENARAVELEKAKAKARKPPVRNQTGEEFVEAVLNCGGPGGKPGPCPKPGGQKPPKSKGSGAPAKSSLSERAQKAKAAHKLVGKDIQRYCEEHNEPRVAKKLGGKSLRNNEPVDVVVGKHGIELKTMVDNGNNKITMKRSAMERKADWERRNKADFHTVVADHQKVYNAKGPGQHDYSKEAFYYRRGYGSFRVGSMHRVTSIAELKKLINTPDAKLPAAAKRPKGQTRGRLA